MILNVETTPIEDLTPHPRNYRDHPEDQLEHLVQSIRQFGVYRNVVVTQCGTILAGHGVVKAARLAGLEEVPVARVDLEPDSPAALKLLALDNEVSHLAVIDDRELTSILKDVMDGAEDGLLGTGFDEQMLANLVMVTRPASEIADFDAAAEWVGMPEFEGTTAAPRLIIQFDSEEDRERCVEHLGVKPTFRGRGQRPWSAWWPPRERDDPSSVMIEG